jgi:hypothetical protein
MTITVPHPYTHQPTPVPHDIMKYCDAFTPLSTSQEDLEYIDCVWMHMGFYGVPKHVMKAVRDEFNPPPIRPVFD